MLSKIHLIIEKIGHHLLLAIRSLWLHKMRTFLSVLGIIIATGAVIALMSFGEGSMKDALADIERIGATNIIIRSVKPVEEGTNSSNSFFAKYGLTQQDYERLQNISTVTRHVPLRIFRQEMRFSILRHTGRVVGTTPDYAKVQKFQIANGRFLTWDENEHMINNAVLGYGIAKKLFPLEDPIGKSVTIRAFSYRIVGVLGYRMPTGGTGGSLAAEDFNDDMYIPLKTCNRRFGTKIYMQTSGSRTGEEVALHQVTVTVDKMDHVKETGRIIKDLMSRYHSKQQDWVVTIPLDQLEQAKQTKRRYLGLLLMIAAISLLVGGIGIMNIMLATVTERTREIGIRRALGAKRRDITAQFLIEAVLQTSIGGVCGVVGGIAIVFLFPPVYLFFTDEALPVVLHVPSIFFGVGFAVLVGVLAGLYPAYRAARLDPIEALRHV